MKILEEKVRRMVHDTNKDKKGVLYALFFLPLTVHDVHAVAQYYVQNQGRIEYEKVPNYIISNCSFGLNHI